MINSKFGELSEQYFDKFGDSFPTYSVSNDIDLACKLMEKAIKENKKYVPEKLPKDITY